MQRDWVGCAAGNFRKGRHGFEPKAIVIHVIVGSLESAGLTFRDPRSAVSAHYGVGKSGRVHQFVEEDDTAFHAGTVVEPTWRLIDPNANPNLYTVGIEHEGQPQDTWPDEQFRASAALVREIAARWKIALDRDHIIMHREIRASKTCPGTVDMERLIREAVDSPVPDVNSTRRIRAATKVNVRRGRAATSAAIAGIIPAGAEFEAAGFTASGEPVGGNSCWYETPAHDYVWAGATDNPDPAQS
jgi:N-acetyl-anhydromuramyl-L-alanine amidase AmpD